MHKIFYLPTVLFCSLVILAGCNGKKESKDISAVPKSATTPMELTQKAVKKQEIGALDEAIGLLNQALKIDPEFDPAYYRMGLVYEEWDKRPEAIQAYKKALELDPANEEARLGLGSVHSKSNRNDLAIQEYQQVAATRPDDPELHFKIALEYWYIQKLSESAEHYLKVLEINPDHMQAHLNLTSVYGRMKDWENAIDQIEIAKRIGKENKDEQAVSIAERKLLFIKGRMNFTEKDMNRKTQPPFE